MALQSEQDQSIDAWRIQSDWYSPTRLHSSPIGYDFPGDRFIPNRSLMDLDQARSLLTNRTTGSAKPKFSEEYRRKLEENIYLDSVGRPFRMLVFRGSPKSSRKSARVIDEMRRSDEEVIDTKQNRQIPKVAFRMLDAPMIKDDYYTNTMDWGKNNILAVALDSEVYLWNSENTSITKLLRLTHNDYPTSVAWSEDADMMAVGSMRSGIQLRDAGTTKLIRSLEGHKGRIGCISWSGHTLTSGGQDKTIITHDVRARNGLISCLKIHTDEVCGLKWSGSGNMLASGGNDNLVYVWEAFKMSSTHFLHKFNNHSAAIKALAWCPYNSDVLASGGGTSDGCIRIWNTKKGTCVNSVNTKAQICGLEWNRHHKEILSGHGFSADGQGNRLCLWRYPSLSKVGEPMHHSSRVLHLSQSPDGLAVVSAGADETLRFWDVFGPAKAENSRVSKLDGLLSLKSFPIR